MKTWIGPTLVALVLLAAAPAGAIIVEGPCQVMAADTATLQEWEGPRAYPYQQLLRTVTVVEGPLGGGYLQVPAATEEDDALFAYLKALLCGELVLVPPQAQPYPVDRQPGRPWYGREPGLRVPR